MTILLLAVAEHDVPTATTSRESATKTLLRMFQNGPKYSDFKEYESSENRRVAGYR